MPVYCCVRSCNSNTTYNPELRFYEFPKIWSRTLKLKKLSELRIQKWNAAVRRRTLKGFRVCSRHFISGKPAKLTDCFNPDWVPKLNLSLPKRISGGKVKAFSITPLTITNPATCSIKANEPEKPLEEEYLEDHLHEIYHNDSEDSEDIEFDAGRRRTSHPAINCCVPNCKNIRSKKPNKVKFFRFPSIKQNVSDSARPTERLLAWIKAINRIDITQSNAHCKIICSDHFQSGAPANGDDNLNVDWIPNQKLPTTLSKAVKKSTNQPTYTNDELDQWALLNSIDPLAEEEIQMQADPPPEVKILPDIKIESIANEIQKIRDENEILKEALTEKDLIIADQKLKIQKQTNDHKLNISEKDKQIQALEAVNLKITLSREGFINDDKKVNYFTGLQSFAILEIIYNFVQEELVGSLLKRINKFDAFILVLLKLRLDLPLAYLGYRFGIAGNTAATIFHTNLKMLSKKLTPFIRWPDKAALRSNTSVYFKRVLGNKFTAMLDFIEDPGPNVSQECLLQKKYVKRKYLIAISPAGAIIFVSNGYDISLDTKEIAETCGVLDNCDDGDIILGDHGSITYQVFSYNGSKVLLNATTNLKGNDLLDTLLQNPTESNVESSSEVNNCRIYIQRSISNLKNKFFILTNKQKVGIAKSYKNFEGECYFDYVVKVCCALMNVSPAILSFETKKS